MLQKGRYMKDIKGIWENLSFIPPCMMLIAAAMTIATAIMLKGFIAETRQNLSDLEEVSSGMALVKRPIDGDALADIQRSLSQAFPDVQIGFSADKKRLEISVDSVEKYHSWMTALMAVPAHGQGAAIWEATEICMGKCDKVSLFASVKAVTQAVEGMNP